MRRVRRERPGQDDLIVVTDLLDADCYPAADLLALYLARWGSERVFQQGTEVFPLKRLLGGAPQASVFHLSCCLLLYNLIQVLPTYVASAAQLPAEYVSLEKRFDDVERELTAWSVLVSPAATVARLRPLPSVAQVRRRLGKLLGTVWQDRWLQAVNEKPRP